ncbi:potassium channel subfamily K member 10-like isoform X1 [Temnothorax curvispinosus]|uniref:Potassium channel subfamily K member 10-like isoform X1 n=1 Tax=Temnothorax curvispinosus TaxID=300111 RepID=A0A6J1PJG9_9HYME|nr:potassium channel subfamily K member 10-like isoform X1 [Temnothorax curvispinosus]
MDVPLFPRPPAIEGVTTPLSDGPSVATLPRVPAPVATSVPRVRRRYAVPLRSSSDTKKRRRICRNLVHPRVRTAALVKDAARRRITEFRMRMTEHRANDEGDDDDDVVCSIDITDTPTTLSSEISPRLKNGVIPTKNWTKSVTVQTVEGLPLRLRFLPYLSRDIEEDNGTSSGKFSRFCKYLRFLGRVSLSQFGLLWILVIWTVAGAAAFCATEGPREREQVVSLKNMQKDLAVGLATELRQLRTEQDQAVEPLWSDKVRQYVAKHEQLLLIAVSSGYGEGGNSGQPGQLWTFPGCVLFAISLITTLGFGAPVPRTNAGRTVGVIFAAIGIPAHFLLILNFGLLVAFHLQKYALIKRGVQLGNTESNYSKRMPRWIKILSFVGSVAYYILGVLCFGIARSRPIAASVLFPLDFTAAGGLSTTAGHVRILYGLYLEGAVTIAAIMVAILRVSATQSLTNIGLKYGLLTEA